MFKYDEAKPEVCLGIIHCASLSVILFNLALEYLIKRINSVGECIAMRTGLVMYNYFEELRPEYAIIVSMYVILIIIKL